MKYLKTPVTKKITKNLKTRRSFFSYNIMIEKIHHILVSIQHHKEARERAESALQQAHDTLEKMVAERTLELVNAKEKAEQANRKKSAFLANMSHEIRTSMNAIMGMTYLATTTEMNSHQQDYLRKIQFSASALLNLINDILDFSKIEAGHLEITKEEFDLQTVFDNLASTMSVEAIKKGINISYDIDEHIPDIIVGDPLRLRQILNNLIGNALKFTEQGYVAVSVILQTVDDERMVLRFSVKDSGIGIAPDQTTSLFSPFTQADAFTTKNFGGTGLGLAISKQLVTMMNGEIGVTSRPGWGSTFFFSAEFDCSHTPLSHYLVKKQALLQQAGVVPDLRKACVLVVEDNIINQQVIQELLERAGVQVTIVNNGVLGVQVVNEKFFDLILMDVQMPEMNGCQATHLIRNHSNGKTRVIIAMTAHAMSGDREKFLAAGMNDYITKPVDPDVLYAVLVKWIVLSPAERHIRETTQTKILVREYHFPTTLPGIEIDMSLQRIGGSRKLFFDILKTFVKNHANDNRMLAKALNLGNDQQARHILHSLYGVASYIGASQLSIKTRALERALLEGLPYKELFEVFTCEFHIVMNGLVDNAGHYSAHTYSLPTSISHRYTQA